MSCCAIHIAIPVRAVYFDKAGNPVVTSARFVDVLDNGRVRDLRFYDSAAEILQINHLLERKLKALSGGQRQRMAIVRAI